jgi:hypothetical protein
MMSERYIELISKQRLFRLVEIVHTNSVGRVTNTISITGGAGRFSGATGTLLLLENFTLDNPDI